MALLALGGVLKEKGVAAELWDFELYFKTVKNRTEEQLRQLLHHGIDGVGTHVFGISAICSNFPMALWIAKEIKAHRPDSLIIVGGAQPSSVPLETLKHFDFIDVVAVGEGERTLAEMVDCNFELERIAEIPGIAMRKENQGTINAKRDLIDDLDNLPMPDYSLIDLDRYVAYDPELFSINVEVGRGCPFNCTFCSTSLMWSKNYRVKSPARILEEMQWLHKQYQFTGFDFIHDNFTTSKKFVNDFCDYMLEHDHNKFEWYCSSRTDCLDIPRVEKMHEAGVRSIFFGIESGSERMQKVIKKHLNFDRFEPILKRIKELGINATTAFILGFPEENRNDMDQTVWRALHYRNQGAGRVFFSKLAALSGTGLYQAQLPYLSNVTHPSSISPQAYTLPYIKQIIKGYPGLFSSYYHIPHAFMDCDQLWKFIEFSQLMVSSNPKLALMVLEELEINATQLFELWDRWALNNDIAYYEYMTFTYADFRIAFSRFVDQLDLNDLNTETDAPAEVLPIYKNTQPPTTLS